MSKPLLVAAYEEVRRTETSPPEQKNLRGFIEDRILNPLTAAGGFLRRYLGDPIEERENFFRTLLNKLNEEAGKYKQAVQNLRDRLRRLKRRGLLEVQ